MWKVIKNRFSALSLVGKIAFIGTALMVGTVFAAAVSPTQEPESPSTKTEISQPTTLESKSVIEVKTITETENISFKTEETTDSNLEKGKTSIVQAGKEGKREIKYEVTYEDDVEVSRKKISETVIVKPVNKIVAVGTYEAPEVPASNCDSNYSGCVPIASDVDCASGSGDGPAYVYGPVEVLGIDIYGLDRDGDGFGCD